MKKAVCLLSGGMDSAVTAAIAQAEGFEVHALSFRYGQRHAVELAAARRIAKALDLARHVEMAIDLAAIGGSALTDAIDVPKDRANQSGAAEIPITYVPARNTVFLACALGWAEVLGARDLYLGVNAIDYSGYPDCRPGFLDAFEVLARQATRAGVDGETFHIHAPLLKLSKAEIVRRAVEMGVDLGLTHSCYDPTPDGLACGHCDACLLRRKGFEEAGAPDPTPYQRDPV